MTQTPATQVVGKGVYLEFVKSSSTTQILILPEGMSTSHHMVPMSMFRRKVSPAQPRKTWKMIASPSLTSAVRIRVGMTLSGAEADTAAVAEITKFVTPLLDSLQSNEWKLYKDPIVIEVTAEDLELARQGKTPYKAMGRIWKVRKALGFPKEFIHDVYGTPLGRSPYVTTV